MGRAFGAEGVSPLYPATSLRMSFEGDVTGETGVKKPGPLGDPG